MIFFLSTGHRPALSLDWAMMSFKNHTKGCLDFAEGKGRQKWKAGRKAIFWMRDMSLSAGEGGTGTEPTDPAGSRTHVVQSCLSNHICAYSMFTGSPHSFSPLCKVLTWSPT